MNDPAAERIDEHLREVDAAELWTPESVYDGRPFRLWWRGLMTYEEYQAHKARIDKLRADYYEWVVRDAQRIMAEMGW